MTAPVIKYSFWLVFNDAGSAPRCTKNPPALAIDERAMWVKAELPRSLFTRPQMTATIQVNEVLQEPFHVDIEAAETVLSEVLGATVVFTVQPPEGQI
ncbi:hypothetical protein LB542_19910 [Mesorhizobium sp. BR1-1-9]|uniref:hypothetical protein n=1 Tax=Mesorhizobium sp. BR1-1-9 TaxID=2876646 RepID=UPI001CD06DB4|nr:hypothetical protein [Mesorhizobium sp. BR1-1-9]MBZ9873117.1 hypothetical protein [Mesorhizobium sp. BR1-1-9]